MEKITLQVSGMSCGHCEKAVKSALLNLEGVTEVNVALKTGKVDVAYNSSKATITQLKEAIEDQGYDVA